VIVTARLFAKEGLTENEAASLLKRYDREIPEESHHCSSRLANGDWVSIDQDIAKAVKNAFSGNGKQQDVDRSDDELTKTVAAWSKYGFKISDKATWEQHGINDGTKTTITWTEADRTDITFWLMPALKIDDPDLAVAVASGIVELTRAKEAEGKGWGYAYLKKWFPHNFGIKCGKKSKQAAVFKALVDLRIIRVMSKGNKGHATRWALGSRALARLGRDDSQEEPTANTQKRVDVDD
jgi:hypothetical protein